LLHPRASFWTACVAATLARALIAGTGLILCDEPPSNLDADPRELSSVAGRALKIFGRTSRVACCSITARCTGCPEHPTHLANPVRTISAVDSGFVVDRGYYSPLDQPQSLDQPR
jgi:hypothetical protein